MLEVLGLNTISEQVGWAESGAVWPNPAQDRLHLKCPDQIGNCRMFDLHGRLVREEPFVPGKVLNWQVNDLHPGTYLVIWHMEHSAQVFRCIID